LEKALEEGIREKSVVDEKLIEQHSITLRVQAELEDTRRQVEEGRRQLSQMGACDEERRQIEAQLRSEICTAKEEAVDMMSNLTQMHQDKLSSVFAEHRDLLSREIAAQKGTHAVEMSAKVAECARLHKEELTSLQRKQADALRVVEERMRESNRESEEKLRKLEERRVLELEAAKLSREEAETALNHQLRQIEVLLNESQERIASLQHEFVELKANHKQALDDCKENWAKDLSEMEQGHKHDWDRLVRQHENEVESLLCRSEEARILQEQQIEMLQHRMGDLQSLYDSRPSRIEDLDIINQLEGEVQEKEAAFKQLFDQMQFYRLELVNREQNYNKTFAAPAVGLLNPMAKKSINQPRIINQQPQQSLPPLGTNGLNIKSKVKDARRPSSGREKVTGVDD